jgi:REP element-mobilizing transposase RayT
MTAQYNPERHHRRSIRLRGYDYTWLGAHFVTICTYERACLFGEVVDGEMRLNEYGQIVREEWFQTAVVRPYVVLYPDEFVVMPNHVHGIIWIVGDGDGGVVGIENIVGAQRRCAPTATGHDGGGVTTTVVRSFKSATTKRINEHRSTLGAVWQRNYYEHIIRNEESLQCIRRYIQANPLRWHLDRENPDARGADVAGSAMVVWQMWRTPRPRPQCGAQP